MRMRSKLILAALVAAMLLAAAVTGATARRLETSERNVELIWDPALSGVKTQA